MASKLSISLIVLQEIKGVFRKDNNTNAHFGLLWTKRTRASVMNGHADSGLGQLDSANQVERCVLRLRSVRGGFALPSRHAKDHERDGVFLQFVGGSFAIQRPVLVALTGFKCFDDCMRERASSSRLSRTFKVQVELGTSCDKTWHQSSVTP